jgi:gluconate 2-dehydrogenase gamma chain
MFTGGIAWLDREILRRYSKDFLSAHPEQQTEMLDLIAYRKNDSPVLGAGIRFFDWARRLMVDGFYTSSVEISDVGYIGNKAVAKFEIPPEAMDYALGRSPV